MLRPCVVPSLTDRAEPPAFVSSEVRFTPPAGWVDRTLVAFVLVGPEAAGDPTLVMTRDVFLPGEDVIAFADRQLVVLAQKLRGFALRGRQTLTLDGRHAVDLRFTWRVGDGPMEQRLICVPGGNAVVLCFGATCRPATLDETDAAFDAMLRTLTFPRRPR